jgi:hypothetical protein
VNPLAAQCLIRLRERNCIETVLPHLKSEKEGTRHYAARVAGVLGERKHAGQLVPLLKADSDLVRRSAAEAIGRLGAKEHSKALIPLLKDSSFIVSCVAALALGCLGIKEAADSIKALKNSELAMLSKAWGSEDLLYLQMSLVLLGEEAAIDEILLTFDDPYPDILRIGLKLVEFLCAWSNPEVWARFERPIMLTEHVKDIDGVKRVFQEEGLKFVNESQQAASFGYTYYRKGNFVTLRKILGALLRNSAYKDKLFVLEGKTVRIIERKEAKPAWKACLRNKK